MKLSLVKASLQLLLVPPSTAYQDSVECLLLLLPHKPDLNARDIYKRTPLMMAAYKGNDKIVGKTSYINLLITCNAITREPLQSMLCKLFSVWILAYILQRLENGKMAKILVVHLIKVLLSLTQISWRILLSCHCLQYIKLLQSTKWY